MAIGRERPWTTEASGFPAIGANGEHLSAAVPEPRLWPRLGNCRGRQDHLAAKKTLTCPAGWLVGSLNREDRWASQFAAAEENGETSWFFSFLHPA